MASLLDEIVITDSNRIAFETVLSIGEEHESPVRMFIYGQEGSGKTTLFQACGKEKNLLSKKSIVSCHAAEVLSFLRLGELGEEFLNKIGSVEVLLLDGFEVLTEDETGSMLAQLLLAERNSQGLETVIASNKPFAELDDGLLKDEFDGYDIVEVFPLDRSGRIELARKIQDGIVSESKDSPTLSEEALVFVADSFCQSSKEVRSAVQFLLTAAGFEAHAAIGVDDAQRALAG